MMQRERDRWEEAKRYMKNGNSRFVVTGCSVGSCKIFLVQILRHSHGNQLKSKALDNWHSKLSHEQNTANFTVSFKDISIVVTESSCTESQPAWKPVLV